MGETESAPESCKEPRQLGERVGRCRNRSKNDFFCKRQRADPSGQTLPRVADLTRLLASYLVEKYTDAARQRRMLFSQMT